MEALTREKDAVQVHYDMVNEQVLLAAAMTDSGARRNLAQRLKPEHFLVESHRACWAAILDVERKGLEFHLSLVAGADVEYLRTLTAKWPDAPPEKNLLHQVELLGWDRQRALATSGPVSALLEALRDPKQTPDRVRALARSVGEAFDGAGESSLREPSELVSSVMADVRKRRAGMACFPFGIEGLDRYEEGCELLDERSASLAGRARMTPGAKPGQTTVLTALSGGGKSTMAAHMALGLARQGRRVLYAAWEPGGNMTLELLACISLGWSRADMMEGRLSDEDEVALEERAHAIAQHVRMMENPFRRKRGGKESNDANLDLVQQHVVDSGCEVFIADLWSRCLVNSHPDEEERALWRQQAMAEETRTHNILLAQQRLKDVEQRADKRPTREGIKGSGAWVEIGDTIIAPHRPALFKRIPDNRLEVLILKQRWGVWPLVVEFDWSAEFGSISNGRGIPFEHAEAGDLGEFLGPQQPQQRPRGRRSRG